MSSTSANELTGVLTGKGLQSGGSLIRPEATGYGAGYFAEVMLRTRGDTLRGRVCTLSGSGDVAQYTIEKLNQLGAKAATLDEPRPLSACSPILIALAASPIPAERLRPEPGGHERD